VLCISRIDIMILIHPYAQKLRNNMPNAKTYHRWKDLILLLKVLDSDIRQIGLPGEEQIVDKMITIPTIKTIISLLEESHYFITIDSFLPHLAYNISKVGVVIWSVSDPKIFGYPANLNILKDSKYLRKNQFGIWEQQSFVEDAFLPPEIIVVKIKERFYNV
jgi:hypothetical protein